MMTENLLRQLLAEPAPVIVGGETFTEADQHAIKWQYHLWGDFYTALWQAIARADRGNQFRIALGFPEDVQGYINWTQGDLYERIQRAGKALGEL